MFVTQPQSKTNANIWATWLALLTIAVFSMAFEFTVSAQGLRRLGRNQRIQKKIERLEKQDARKGSNKFNSPVGASTEPSSPRTGTSVQPNNLAGIKETGDVTQIFTPEQKGMIIRGFGRPPALIMIFNQLNLSEEQKGGIKAISQRVGNRLGILQLEVNRLEGQLEVAIYGDSFDAKRVDELSAQVAEKQAEIIRLRANIEGQIRQVLTPDQLFAYRYLLNEMVILNRKPGPQMLRQQQMQRRMGGAGANRPNQQNQQNSPQDN